MPRLKYFVADVNKIEDISALENKPDLKIVST